MQQHSDPQYGGNGKLKNIFTAVMRAGKYNFIGASRTVPSGLKMEAWRRLWRGYPDYRIVEYLQFGWPVNHDRETPLVPTAGNHPSADNCDADVEHYITIKLGKGALAGPFAGPPGRNLHTSPLMTKPKRDSKFRRVIMDLSWPKGAAVNDGIDTQTYIDGPATITLPTTEYMAERVVSVGRGAYMFKSELTRGYCQLRVDPSDWPLLGFTHNGRVFMDICPPIGLRTSAMFMQRTTQAVCFIHARRGYLSRAYLDDFGGAEAAREHASGALHTLQDIMSELGLEEATHKVCQPSQQMVWLGIAFDTLAMTMTIPPTKMEEVMDTLRRWAGKTRATQRETQSLLGVLQFVASVSPPVRVYTNRMLQDLREMPTRGSTSLSLRFKRDIDFFVRLLPAYNGVRILDKACVECQDHLELDACLTGCGATTGDQYYSEVFPQFVQQTEHSIAHLELLNVIVATKTWQEQWAGKRILVSCDNMNACLAIQTRRTRDVYMQACIQELFAVTTTKDNEMRAEHCPGKDLVRADALSRLHTGGKFRDFVNNDKVLQGAGPQRVLPPHF